MAKRKIPVLIMAEIEEAALVEILVMVVHPLRHREVLCMNTQKKKKVE